MKRLSILALAASIAACGPTPDFDASIDVRDVTTRPRDASDATANDAASAMDARDDGSTALDAADGSAMDVGDSAADANVMTADVFDASDARDGAALDASRTDASAPDVTGTDARDVVDSGADAAADSAADASMADARSDAAADAAVDSGVVIAPVVDGVISANEYGAHVEGQNQRTDTMTSVTWFMRSTDVGLNVAITGANLAEGAVLYLGSSAAGDAGSATDGTLQGFATYDSTRLDPLPFRASFVVYFKNGYQEFRRWNGVDAWAAPVTAGISYASNSTGNVREILIPWASIRAAGRPASFSFTGYVTSATGFAYGQMPPENPRGMIGTSALFPYSYRVVDSAPVGGTPPFSQRVP